MKNIKENNVFNNSPMIYRETWSLYFFNYLIIFPLLKHFLVYPNKNRDGINVTWLPIAIKSDLWLITQLNTKRKYQIHLLSIQIGCLNDIFYHQFYMVLVINIHIYIYTNIKGIIIAQIAIIRLKRLLKIITKRNTHVN